MAVLSPLEGNATPQMAASSPRLMLIIWWWQPGFPELTGMDYQWGLEGQWHWYPVLGTPA